MTAATATGLGIAINFATDLKSNAVAWLAVVVLAIAGAVVGLHAEKLNRGSGQRAAPSAEVTVDRRHGVSQSSASGRRTMAVAVSGEAGRITINSHTGWPTIAVGLVVIVATLGGLVIGARMSADRPSVPSSNTTPNSASQAALPPGWVAEVQTPGCDSGWVVPDHGATSIPVTDGPPSADAVLGSGGPIAVTLQGVSDEATVLQSISVEIVNRSEAVKGIYLPGQCGSDVIPSFYAVDLEQASLSVVPVAGRHGDQAIPAKEFSFKVGRNDIEKIIVTPKLQTGYAEWIIRIKWTSGSVQGDLRIDDHGKPFRTTAATAAARWCATAVGTYSWMRPIPGVPCP